MSVKIQLKALFYWLFWALSLSTSLMEPSRVSTSCSPFQKWSKICRKCLHSHRRYVIDVSIRPHGEIELLGNSFYCSVWIFPCFLVCVSLLGNISPLLSLHPADGWALPTAVLPPPTPPAPLPANESGPCGHMTVRGAVTFTSVCNTHRPEKRGRRAAAQSLRAHTQRQTHWHTDNRTLTHTEEAGVSVRSHREGKQLHLWVSRI